ncbi:MAG: indole-3-glycerol-phosphate synthase [Methanomicrobiales archaeon]|nr:indole-3-glycerol-phosphate synthase [Methanomicrobiales archaeon]
MILDEILKSTRDRVASLELDRREVPSRATVSLGEAIARAPPRNAVIAELKLASPTLGSLRSVQDLEWLAGEAVQAGCIALSVLTEPHFFGGSTRHLEQVRRITDVPILRKDFIIDLRQLDETRALGADAVLLIAAVLGDRLPGFLDLCEHLSLEALVEVHNGEEADLAIESGARLIGVNNRDLRTMGIDLETTRRLSGRIRGRGRLVVAESGIRSLADLRSLKTSCDAFLIGTAITLSRDPGKTVEALVCA